MAFRRRRRDGGEGAPEQSDVDVDATDALEDDEAEQTVRPGGPYDVDDVEAPGDGRVDVGSLWVPVFDGMEMRVEVDEGNGEMVAVTLVHGDSSVQLAPFAAPRTSGIWEEVRMELRGSVASQGGTADEVEGPFGTELRARMPIRRGDGSSGSQRVRFIGVDGPRWFLRGVFSGTAADHPERAAEVEALFRQVVVVRGSTPMAPRELIPIRLPSTPADGTEDEPGEVHDPLNPFARGPEITEVR